MIKMAVRFSLTAALVLCMGMILAGCNPYGVYEDKRSLDVQLDDAVIETAIKTKLMDRDLSQGWDVSVFSYEGRVFLAGEVPQRFREQAVRVARSEKGVRSVTAHWFSGPGSTQDMSIRLRVNRNLIEASRVSSTRLDLVVHNGDVLLFGMIDSKATEERILRIVKDTDGVKKVFSYLIFP